METADRSPTRDTVLGPPACPRPSRVQGLGLGGHKSSVTSCLALAVLPLLGQQPLLPGQSWETSLLLDPGDLVTQLLTIWTVRGWELLSGGPGGERRSILGAVSLKKRERLISRDKWRPHLESWPGPRRTPPHPPALLPCHLAQGAFLGLCSNLMCNPPSPEGLDPLEEVSTS